MDSEQLLAIGLKKRNKQISDSWDALAVGTPFRNGEAYRLWVKNQTTRESTETPNNEETVEIHKDGSQSSHKLVRMSFEDSKDPEYLLKSHGYSVDAWELITARSNIWNAYSKQDGIRTLYSSRITVKPKSIKFTWDRLLVKFESIPRVTIKPKLITSERYLRKKTCTVTIAPKVIVMYRRGRWSL